MSFDNSTGVLEIDTSTDEAAGYYSITVYASDSLYNCYTINIPSLIFINTPVTSLTSEAIFYTTADM
jgi:hypothetical protein